jgi:uncharacterized protein (DUF1800 family)
VVHLHRRAGFAATWGEIQRDLKGGPDKSVDRVLAGKSRADGVPEDFESTARLLADAAVASNDPERVKAWWIYRMLLGPDALGERLTLLWHDHFATSNAKVNDLAAMHRQNEALRELARAPFGAILERMVHDPALLGWLDAPSNRKGHANENLARELMELFTLGIGQYSEDDIKEAARALTGWTVRDGEFAFNASQHDEGDKTIFGRTADWTGDDLVKSLLDKPATAHRLAWRLCGALMGERAVEPSAIDALAEGLRAHDLDIGWGVATVLRSRAFFADANLRTRVVAPVEFVVGSARALEIFDPPPSTLVMADWAARQGQDLFYPPNVGGWPGGRGWLTSRALIGRANYAAALIEGPAIALPAAFNAQALAEKHIGTRDRDAVIGFVAQLILGYEAPQTWRDGVVARTVKTGGDDEALRRAVISILASPEAQLA